jgi:predicted O-methyltransferase YrrM
MKRNTHDSFGPETLDADNIRLPGWKLHELQMKENYACFIDKDLNVYSDEAARDKLISINDAHYVSPAGIISVSKERWREAQQYERKTWMEQGISAFDDRNHDHLKQFNDYACLKNRQFESVLELGCGPFTNLRLILPLIQGVKKVTLLDPLIDSYLHHPNCTYKDGYLSGFPIDVIPSTIEDYTLQEQFDLVVIINVLEHCYNVPQIFSSIIKLLKPNGILVISDVVVENQDVRATNVYDAGHPIRIKEHYLKSYLEQNFSPLYWRKLYDAAQHSHRETCHYYIGSRNTSATSVYDAVTSSKIEVMLARSAEILLWRKAIEAKQQGNDRASLIAIDSLLAGVPDFAPAIRFIDTLRALPHLALTYTDIQDELIERGLGFHDSFIVMEQIIRERGLKIGAELGVFQGYHSLHLLQANPELRLYCVDAYRQLRVGIGYDDVSDTQFEELYRTVLSRLTPTGRARLMRTTTDVAAMSISEALDFIFIDADHSYDGVIKDFLAWYPLVKVGGIIAGHDYDHPEWPGVKQAVIDMMQLFDLHVSTDRGYVWWAEKTETSVDHVIDNSSQLPADASIKLLLGILDNGYDTSTLRMALAKTYLRLNLPTQAREFLKTVSAETDRNEAERLLEQIHPKLEFTLPELSTLEEDLVSGAIDSTWVVASASSASHFPQLVNLIGSLHRHCLAKLWKIVVYDIGLHDEQVAYLNNLALVKVKKVPLFNPHGMAWWNWKLWLLKDCAEQETTGPYMYFDAGTEVERDLTPLFETIQRQGYLLWHAGGHLNRDWTTAAIYKQLDMTKDEDDSLQLMATVQGYAARGIDRISLVDAAYSLGMDERLLRPSVDCPNNRHDQSLLSLLIKTQDKILNDPHLDIAWEYADHESSSIWLCRQNGIMRHNGYLKRKRNCDADMVAIVGVALKKTGNINAEIIAQGEEMLFGLSMTDIAWMSHDVLKDNAISGALHSDIIFQAFLDAIIRGFNAEYIVETGTFLGWTTSFLAQNYPSCTIITTDSNCYFSAVSRNRLANYPNVQQVLKSSDLFIKDWLPTASPHQRNIFFLDAHWESYWPLPDEIRLISQSTGSAVIIIDDFMVPDRPEYGFDDYGNGKAINLDSILANLDPANSYKCLFPDYSGKEAAIHCQHLRGRCIIFQNCDDLFASLCHNPWVTSNFSDASALVTSGLGKNDKKAKIVALMPVKNVADNIDFFLRAVSRFSDAICIYDDASEDDTPEIVARLANECRIEKIISNRNWVYNETNYRQPLLDAGREIGGTHFIIIDADEAFTANLCDNDQLRKEILKLQPGDQLSFAWIQLWRSLDHYRHDGSVWTNNYKGIVFCDDGKCSYHHQIFHLQRVPSNLVGSVYTIEGYHYGLLHFQFVNWRNLLVKQAWYRCLERTRDPEKSVQEINALYAPSKDESSLGLVAAPISWFDNYEFLEKSLFNKREMWREKQVQEWFNHYGREFFSGLDIWDIDWFTPEDRPRKLEDICLATMTETERRLVAEIDQIGGWFSTEEILSLYRLIKTLPRTSRILEIGSYRGRSTNAIGHAMEGTVMELYCLDVWRDFIDQGIRQTDTTAHYLLPTDSAIFQDFIKNTERFGDKIRILRGSTCQFSNLLRDRLFDLIFIDGAHDYDNVHRDIATALKWLKPGGILCGHDYHSDAVGVIRAAEELVFSNRQFIEYGVITGTSLWFARHGDRNAKTSTKLNERMHQVLDY